MIFTNKKVLAFFLIYICLAISLSINNIKPLKKMAKDLIKNEYPTIFDQVKNPINLINEKKKKKNKINKKLSQTGSKSKCTDNNDYYCDYDGYEYLRQAEDKLNFNWEKCIAEQIDPVNNLYPDELDYGKNFGYNDIPVQNEDSDPHSPIYHERTADKSRELRGDDTIENSFSTVSLSDQFPVKSSRPDCRALNKLRRTNQLETRGNAKVGHDLGVNAKVIVEFTSNSRNYTGMFSNLNQELKGIIRFSYGHKPANASGGVNPSFGLKIFRDNAHSADMLAAFDFGGLINKSFFAVALSNNNRSPCNKYYHETKQIFETFQEDGDCSDVHPNMDSKCYDCQFWPETAAKKDKLRNAGYRVPTDDKEHDFSINSVAGRKWINIISMNNNHPGLMGLGDWGKYDKEGNDSDSPNFPASQLFVPNDYVRNKCFTGQNHLDPQEDGTTQENPFYCFSQLGLNGENAEQHLQLYV